MCIRDSSRGLAAYVLSLAFTLLVGTLAARSRRAERILIPLLDIGQGIPVLGFLPGLVLGMVEYVATRFLFQDAPVDIDAWIDAIVALELDGVIRPS